MCSYWNLYIAELTETNHCQMHHPACAVPNRSETSTNQNFRLKGKTIERNKQNEGWHQLFKKNLFRYICLLSYFRIWKKFHQILLLLDYDNPEYLFFLLLNNDMNFYAIRRFLSLLDASGYVNIHMGIKLLMATIAKDLQIW